MGVSCFENASFIASTVRLPAAPSEHQHVGAWGVAAVRPFHDRLKSYPFCLTCEYQRTNVRPQMYATP